ncbi:MAG TPA: hypothetical protein VFW65_28120 [Pseudonocardiaceae bacterium]|nr:hypothetical protein [Pseudonocardiaceae bacterium]
MGHKGIRDGGPPRRPGFRPADVVGRPVAQALIELAHGGFQAELAGAAPRTQAYLSNRVHVTVHDGLVVGVTVG